MHIFPLPFKLTTKHYSNRDIFSTINNLVCNIRIRHIFLQKFIGTKREEDDSMEKGIRVPIVFSVLLITACLLELIFYMIYNRVVTGVKRIHKGSMELL